MTFVAGSALTLVSGWVSDLRSARRDREAREESRRDTLRLRRDDFQRETLIALQDAAMRLLSSTAAVMQEDVKAYRDSGQWQSQDLGAPFNEGFRIATEELRLLASRVRNEQVRNLTTDFRRRCAKAIQSGGVDSVEESLVSITDAHKLVNEAAGQLIRDLDESD